MKSKGNKKSFIFKRYHLNGYFLFLPVFLLFSFLIGYRVLAVDGIMNGKTITGTTDNYLFWLQTYNESTPPYFFDRFFVDKSGNVGIGTITPSQKLHVNGGAQLDAISYGVSPGSDQILALSTVEYVNSMVSGTGTSTVGYWSKNGNNIYNSNSGNVGIGTSNPTSKLYVNSGGGANSGIVIGSNGSTGSYASLDYVNKNNVRLQTGLYDSGDAFFYMSAAGNNIGFHTNDLQRMTITKGGNIGIGASNPLRKLDIAGGVFIGTTSGAVEINNVGYTGYLSGHSGIIFSTNHLNTGLAAGEKMRLMGNGNLTIGKTNSIYKLDVAGTANFDGLVTGVTPGTTQKLALSTVEYVNSMVSGVGTSTVGYWSKNGDNIYNANSGNVGIGTMNPLGVLDVAPSTWGANAWSYFSGNVNGSNPSSSYLKGLSLGWNRTGGHGETNLIFGTNIGTSPRLEIGEWSGSVYAADMVVKAGGNVGIGTTNPMVKLEVNGAGKFLDKVIIKSASPTILENINGSTSGNQIILGASWAPAVGSTYSNAQTFLGLNAYQTALGTNNWKKGIGSAYTANAIFIGASNNNTGDAFSIRTSPVGVDNTSWNFFFSAPLLVVKESGSVGIGTTAPAQKLHVNGGAQFDAVSYGVSPGSDQDLALATVEYVNTKAGGAGGIATGTSGQTLRHDGTSWVANSILYNNGTKIGIGTTMPGQKLDVVGNIRSSETIYASALNLTYPIQNFNAFTPWKMHNSVETNLLAGKWPKLKVSINGVENTTVARILTDQNYEQYGEPRGLDGDPDKVINIDLISNGLYGVNGIGYASGYVVLSFYSSPFPSGWSARVKNKDGVWTAMTLTKVGNTLVGTIPISLYLTDIEVTLSTGTGGPYVTGSTMWSLAEFEYYGTRMTINQGASVTSVGGYLGGDLTVSDGFKIGQTSGPLITFDDTNNYLEIMGGNVGIGTSNPESRLSIQGAFATDSNPPVVNLALRSGYGTGTSQHGIGFYVNSSTYLSSGIFAPPGALSFFTSSSWSGLNATEKMRIDSLGSVGIGTTAPSQKLHVNGGAQFDAVSFGVTPGLSQDLALSTVEYVNSMVSGTGTSTVGYWSASGNNIYNANSGNVGIGTSNPSHKLSVMGSGYFLGDTSVPNAPVDLGFYLGKSLSDENRRMEIVSPAGGVSYMDFTQPSADFKGRIAYYLSDNSFRFYTNTLERLRLDASGNVGIGTTNPGAKLDVNGLLKLSGGIIGETPSYQIDLGSYYDNTGDPSVSHINIYGGTVGFGMSSGRFNIFSGGYDTHFLKNATTTNLIIKGSGNVGIGMTAPQAKLSVVATTSYGTDISYAIHAVDGVNSLRRLVLGYDDSLNAGIIASIHSGTAWTNTLINPAGGKVGIGTTAPTQKLHVNGGAQFDAISYGVSPGSDQDLALTTVEYVNSMVSGVGTSTVGYWSASGNNIYNANSANVGVGTSAPANKLDVAGNLGVNGILKGYGASNGNFFEGKLGVNSLSAGASSLAVFGNAAIGTSYLSTSAPANGLIVQGKVGIGTSAPTEALHIIGNLKVEGGTIVTGNLNMSESTLIVDKITANTIDPLYTIDNIKYSTFAPSIVGGVKEEYVGRISSADFVAAGDEYEVILDMTKLEAGSDLWVWRQVVDFSSDNVEVFLTPKGERASMYADVKDEKIIIRSDRAVDAYLRLLGKRYDWRAWPTKVIDQNQPGGLLID